MRILQRLLLLIIFLFVFVLSLDMVMGGLWGLGVHPVLAHTPGLRFWLSANTGLKRRIFWLGMSLMPVLYLLISLASLRRPGAFLVESRNGEKLHLDRAALTKFARVQIENHPAVVAQKVSVRQSGASSISVVARVTVRPIQSLPAIRTGLEKCIRDGFSQVMGIEKIDDVKIIIGLDERSIGERPGIEEERPEPRPEPPMRSELPPLSPPAEPLSAPAEITSSSIAFEHPSPDLFDADDAGGEKGPAEGHAGLVEDEPKF